MGITGLSISLCKPGALGAQSDAEPEKPACSTPSAGTPVAENLEKIHPAEAPVQGVQPQGAGYEAIKDEAFKEVLMRLARSIIEKNLC
jgi:hypothetical protein